MADSKIEWTGSTWNPVTGCTKTSPGCLNCYAERMARRLQAMGQPNYAGGFQLATHEHMLRAPLKWRTPKTIFVNSMSDLFHVDVPVEFIHSVFDVMNEANWHTFQILTKRSKRLRVLGQSIDWRRHVWMGVSVENSDCQFRIDDLREVDAHVKFLSIEPLLGPLPELDLTDINWVVVGGESGPGARPMDPGWVREIRDQCIDADTPFFFKQWGGVHKKKNGRTLDGQTWDEMPISESEACA